MLGRVILLPVNKFLGERRALFLYGFLSLGLDFVIWFVPSLIGGAVTVSIIGILLGPLFPIAMNQCARFLPPSILTGAIGWVAGFGYAGAALIPFITGAIADGHGIKSMHPVYVPPPVTFAANSSCSRLEFFQCRRDDNRYAVFLLADASGTH